MKKEYFDFSDVRLIPRKGIVSSREECDTSVTLGKHTFKLPIVPSNMLSTVDEAMCIKLASNGYFYIHHRFNHDNITFIKNMNSLGLITSISIGVKDQDYTLIDTIVKDKLKVDYICIDIAHGHSILLEKIAKYAKNKLPNVTLIGGNICTKEAVNDLTEWGCDILKIGIGSGSICTTFFTTSMGSRDWQASCIYELSKISRVPIICDGSIKNIGSVCAALSLGATMVMAGGLCSGYEDSPGSVVVTNGKMQKEYFGSSTEFTKGHTKHIEGIKQLIEYKHGSLIDYLNTTATDGLKSSISYAGGNKLSDLRLCKFIVI